MLKFCTALQDQKQKKLNILKDSLAFLFFKIAKAILNGP